MAVPIVADVDLGRATLLPDLDRRCAYLLALDGVPQSYVDLDHPEHLEFEYVRRMAHVLDLIRPDSVLHLGGGGMSLPRYVAATMTGVRQQVAEIDGRLLALVQQYLPFDPSIAAFAGAARATVEAAASHSVDVIVADVFAGARIPADVVSAEFFTEAARVLSRGGWYIANLADQAPFPFTRAVAATAQATLGGCRLAAEPAVFRGRRFGNVLLVCGELPEAALARRLAGDPFPARLQTADEFADFIAGAQVISDGAAVDSPQPPEGYFSLP